MAERVQMPTMPAYVAVLPFLFMAPARRDREWDFQAALGAAVAAEQAGTEPRNTLRRVSYMLCELGFQYSRRTGDMSGAVPLSRTALARALGVSLTKVKRILALLSLSRAIESDEAGIKVVDWRRLCSVAAYDAARLGALVPDEDEPLAANDEDDEPARLTAAGEPACFV
jgi:hypothetical protein